MHQSFLHNLSNKLKVLHKQSLYKIESVLDSAQQPMIQLQSGHKVINLCANNYLGLANHPAIIKAAQTALKNYGYGLSSVRFICGTQSLHLELEAELAKFLQTEQSILFSSCFDANAGLFEALFSEKDIIISDELNHASIIDGIRLCKAKRVKYQHNNMLDLEQQLSHCQAADTKVIVTDAVFSMDGTIANLPEICQLAEQYQALVIIDDSHGLGVLGTNGQGTAAHFGLSDKITITTGTLGKALGGASGGFVAAKSPIVDFLRQRARPYLFSNSLAPLICGASLAALKLLTQKGDKLQQKLLKNTLFFRTKLEQLGFDILPGEHPIVPIMLPRHTLATKMATALLQENIYVVSFSYPVVPKDKSRIRVQLSAAHTTTQLKTAIDAFKKVGQSLGIIQ